MNEDQLAEFSRLKIKLARTIDHYPANIVKVIDSKGRVVAAISPAQAYSLITSTFRNRSWIGEYRSSRHVTAIRYSHIDRRRPLPFRECYRNTGAACLPPSIDWVTKVGTR